MDNQVQKTVQPTPANVGSVTPAPTVPAPQPSVPVTSRATGDIVINDPAMLKQKKRKRIIVVAVLLAIAIVVVVLVVVIGVLTSKNTIEQVQESFASYTQLLKQGENGQATNNTWFIETINEENPDLQAEFDEMTYATALQEAFTSFQAACLNLDEDTLGSFETNLEQSALGLQLMTIYLRLEAINEELMAAYLAEGETGADNYVNGLFSEPLDDLPFFTTLAGLLRGYLATNIDLYGLYDDHGCFANGYLSTSCIGNIDANSTGLAELFTELDLTYDSAQGLAPLLASSLVTLAQKLQLSVEALHA